MQPIYKYVYFSVWKKTCVCTCFKFISADSEIGKGTGFFVHLCSLFTCNWEIFSEES